MNAALVTSAPANGKSVNLVIEKDAMDTSHLLPRLLFSSLCLSPGRTTSPFSMALPDSENTPSSGSIPLADVSIHNMSQQRYPSVQPLTQEPPLSLHLEPVMDSSLTPLGPWDSPSTCCWSNFSCNPASHRQHNAVKLCRFAIARFHV